VLSIWRVLWSRAQSSAPLPLLFTSTPSSQLIQIQVEIKIKINHPPVAQQEAVERRQHVLPWVRPGERFPRLICLGLIHGDPVMLLEPYFRHLLLEQLDSGRRDVP